MTNAERAKATMKEYAKGNKAMAYIAFKNDPTSVEGVTFEQFCNAMERMMNQVIEICNVTKKVKLAKDFL